MSDSTKHYSVLGKGGRLSREAGMVGNIQPARPPVTEADKQKQVMREKNRQEADRINELVKFMWRIHMGIKSALPT